MGNLSKSPLNASVVHAIDAAVKHALEEKLHAAEDEIVDKVIDRLDHKNVAVVTAQPKCLYNPLAGP